MRDEILSFVNECVLFNNFDELKKQSGVVTEDIVKKFNLSRTQSSRLLNDLVKSDNLIKINSRPVIFLPKNKINDVIGPTKKSIYENVDELNNECKLLKQEIVFNSIIGHDNSLKEVIEQIKTAVLYPNGGLTIMLTGDSGVGKTFLAKIIYKYSVSSNVLEKNAPYNVLNCAQYYNNLELLSSILFGYVKGAYTGANESRAGLIEQSDGGVLFLDEVHRLNSEGQEKLFTFMDTGTFSRIGENGVIRRARVRLVFATTESLSEFLQTFLRRIPINIYVPNIEERGTIEKRKIVEHFIYEESKVLGLPIEITQITLNMILKIKFKGNIGECKNVIKYACGRAYAKNQRRNGNIFVTLQDLPRNIYIENIDIFQFQSSKSIVFSPKQFSLEISNGGNKRNIIYQSVIKCLDYFDRLEKNEITKELFSKKSSNLIIRLMDNLVFSNNDENNNVLMELIISIMQDIFRNLEVNNNIKYDGNNVLAFSSYLYLKEESYQLSDEYKALESKLLIYLRKENYKEYSIVNKVSTLITNRLDMYLNNVDTIIMIIFIKSTIIRMKFNQVNAIIVAHGYATASSMANVCNRILGKNVFTAIDMPINSTIADVSKQMSRYLDGYRIKNGLIVLFDMGSLNLIYGDLKNKINSPMLFIDQISTISALEVGNLLIQGKNIEEIAEIMDEEIKPNIQLYYPQKNKEYAIVSSCFTGIGTAIKIQHLLSESLIGIVDVKIIPYDYDSLVSMGDKDPIFEMYDVLAIVGTANPNVNGVDFILLEDIISGKGEDDVFRIFSKVVENEKIKNINDSIVKNFSLIRVIDSLTILDSKKIIERIEEGINVIESIQKKKLPNDKKIALYVHLSCMIERLVRKAEIEEYTDMNLLIRNHHSEVKLIKNAFSVLEKSYSVQIPISEIGYIYNIIYGLPQ
ncbi:sigma 54-interacting transcriptional regulator [Clostridioides sp. ZZV15-6383]|uniref:sigma 54-interacting transcriptional regulator n=1 Tax=Clostridioides sp. ZZV15-6383 TaxID=2811498 RepID=UPI001D10703F|nr:sigma 54-interacting transcriptional regulator [Clostridioides sp. ZZV15-6383]